MALRPCPATIHWSENPQQPKEISPRIGPQLWWGICRNTLLSIPAHSWLWGVWMGLDHCTQALPGQLLLRGVWVPAPAAVPTCTSGKQGQSKGHRWALLHTHQDVTHQHAVFQSQGTDHLWKDTLYGGRPLWLLLKKPCRTQALTVTLSTTARKRNHNLAKQTNRTKLADKKRKKKTEIVADLFPQKVFNINWTVVCFHPVKPSPELSFDQNIPCRASCVPLFWKTWTRWLCSDRLSFLVPILVC